MLHLLDFAVNCAIIASQNPGGTDLNWICQFLGLHSAHICTVHDLWPFFSLPSFALLFPPRLPHTLRLLPPPLPRLCLVSCSSVCLGPGPVRQSPLSAFLHLTPLWTARALCLSLRWVPAACPLSNMFILHLLISSLKSNIQETSELAVVHKNVWQLFF